MITQPDQGVRRRRGRLPHNSQAGVTLMELVIVLGIIGLIVGVSFPSIAGGIDSVRLTSATDSIAAFLNGAMNRAERRQQAVELVILVKENKMQLFTNEPGFSRELVMPEGVQIVAVLPSSGETPDSEPRRLMLVPGGTAPAIGVEVANRRGAHRIVRVDPMTGFPRVESVPTK